MTTPGSGNSYVVPAGGTTNWTVTSWSHIALGDASQVLTMKIFRPLGGATYTVVGHDTRPLAPDVLNTFPVSIAAKPGDVLGLYSNTASGCIIVGADGGVFHSHTGDLADGAQADFSTLTSSALPNISAVLSATNTFTLGNVTRNKKKGTATLAVDVSNPGELAVSGKGVKAAGAPAAISKTLTAPGAVTLTIRATGKKKTKLNQTGKVKVEPTITYTPTGGDPRTQSRKLKLKKR